MPHLRAAKSRREAAGRPAPDVRAGRGRGKVWALCRRADGRRRPTATLREGRFVLKPKAAQILGLAPAVLRVAWPCARLAVRRTQSGRYAPPEGAWPASAWLAAVAGALAAAGEAAFDERLLLAAVRSLPGVPDVQGATWRRALQTCPAFGRTAVPGVWRVLPSDLPDAGPGLRRQ